MSGTAAACTPQHHSVPSSFSAHDRLPPPAVVTTELQSVSLPIWTGSVRSSGGSNRGEPLPSTPCSAQHHSVPPVLIAQVSPPTATVVQSWSAPTWTAGSPGVPGNDVQHHSAPSSFTAHTLSP